jgi:AAA family ATP:ADP antiporter
LSFRERVQKAVNVRPGEGRTTALMLAHSFFMGLSTVFFETAASALFLERFGPGVLPLVYIVAAVLNTLTGTVYAGINDRVSFRALMSGTLVFLLATTVGLRIGLAVSGAAWLLFALLVWYRAISALTDLEYWAVAGSLFDVRQAKRLYGFIGSGEVVARIAGSFAVPLLVHVLGVQNLLALSAAAMAACLGLVWMVLIARKENAPAPAHKAHAAGKAGWGESTALVRDRYLMLIFALSFFGVLAKYFVDFAFLAEMKSRYGDAKGLASFFAVFSGVSQVLSLLTRVFVSGRLLDRYGIRIGLLVLPAAQVLCTLVLMGSGAVSASGAAVFWLVIANQGIYKTLKHPIDNPSFKVLYQPLKKDRRLSAQIAVETLVTPVTIGIAGGVMLLFTRVLHYDPVKFAAAMLVDFGGWMAMAAMAGGAYVGALKDALKGRLDDEHASELLSDEASLRVLRERLKSARADEVLAALELLDHSAQPRLDDAVLGLLDSPEAEVRLAGLAYVGRHRPQGAQRAVQRTFDRDPSTVVRAAALRCLCALAGVGGTKALVPFLEHPSEPVRRAAAIGLLSLGVAEASERAAALAASADPADRTWAAQVLGETGAPGLHALLAPLLSDAVPAVRRAALAAAARLRAPELWPLVAQSLEQRVYAGAAAAALAAGGADAVEELEHGFHRARHSVVRSHIVRVWGRLGGAAVPRLVERLRFPESRVRHDVLVALHACGYRAEGEAAAPVEAALRVEAEDAAWKLAVLRDLGESAETAHVRAALATEIAGAQRRLLLLFSFLLDANAIRRAADNLTHESRDRRAYALEMLDVTLPADWRAQTMPLFEELAVEQRCEKMAALFPQTTETPGARIAELLSQPRGRLMTWTTASVIHATAALEDDVSMTLTHAEDEALLQETAEWARAERARRSGGGAPLRRRAMLTIEKVIMLKSVHMFEEASDEVLADVASIVEEMDVARGEVVFEKGEPGDSMYVIVEGGVRVYDGERTILDLGPRDIFGELALLDPEPRLASIAATAPTRLLRLDREAFLELMEANIEIVRGVLHVLCERLRRFSQDRGPYRDLPARSAAAKPS